MYFSKFGLLTDGVPGFTALGWYINWPRSALSSVNDKFVTVGVVFAGAGNKGTMPYRYIAVPLKS